MLRRAFPLALFSLLTAARLATALEPWADPQLPVQSGLALWLDAGAEPRAAAAENPNLTKDTVLPGRWHDASGFKRDALQPDPAAQPVLEAAYPAKVFAFDGRAQHFAIDSAGWKLREATVFVFARARSNAGGFRGLISASAPGTNDYRSGFNLDLGSKATPDALSTLNVEGAGFSGEQNLLRETAAFGATASFAAVFASDKVTAYLGLHEQGSRARQAGELSAEHLLLGARFCDQRGAPPAARDFFQGDLFEVLIYDRALSAAEVMAVNRYLAAKYIGVVFVAAAKPASDAGTAPLVAVKDPPMIQPLVPGFVARRLPVQLSNVNFLRYRPDGRLYAGAYDGKIYILRDTDGDGLEDHADVFYQGEDLKLITGMALTPPGYPRGEGVFVATRGRILLILDKDGDGHGDEVVTVAKDWEKAQVVGGGVSDALGVALGPDGSVYFSLGTSNFTNAYLLDAATGVARYRTTSERGTMQRVSPDFAQREPVCTGLRVCVGLAFNARGDLFATEQEGATWLANGNPFDELLHIQTGRHYGFPPRHPQHLPDVVDEPSTFDYAPQHQSAVGLAFDEPAVAGGPIFGPEWWSGDALVSAMSRGKIFRTKLVKTPAGYVAKNETFAQLQHINIDQAVSPRGALVVTIHSGSPDWGTGPTGAGELWQIAPLPRAVPRPVIAWSASPTELRVSLDAPLPESALSALQGHVTVTQGRYVEAGDRFETMRPGYQVVKNQLATPRYLVPVQKVALADDARTLVITTPARSAAVQYGITIATDLCATGGAGAYVGQLDLLTDLTGLEAEWQAARGPAVKAWLPHPDTAVARAFTAADGAHREFWSHLAEAGSITFRGQLDLGQMLQPAVQVGSKLDWEYPDEQVTVVLSAARPFQFTLGEKAVASQPVGGRHEARQQVTARSGLWLPLTITLSSASGDPALTASWFTDRSATERPFPLRRILLPYARAVELAPQPRNDELPQLAGGNWTNGQTLFFGQATCSLCHTMRGAGGRVGPDLTNLIYRDYDSVLRDIRDPNAAINPEHVAYRVLRKDGTEIAAVLLAENDASVSFAQIGGQVLDVPRADIASLTQLSTSLMPVGLDKALQPEQLRDLMTYLLVPPHATEELGKKTVPHSPSLP